MTWVCAAAPAPKDYPEAQLVRLRYVEEPRFEEAVSGKGLCDQLTSTAKKIVTVDFDTWGNGRNGLVGYEILAIDDKKIVYAGGYGGSSVTGQSGPHPLSSYFK